MAAFDRNDWLVWGNIAVFAIVCAVTLMTGADASAAMLG
jgi:hypothetical protein